MSNISIHGSHNAAIAFNINNKFYVIEAERFIGYKNSGLAQYKSIPCADIVIKQILDFINSEYNVNTFDECCSSYSHSVSIINNESKYIKYETDIPCKKHIRGLTHHTLHAYSTFYQSPFEKNIIISFDGGGDDGFFNIYEWTQDQDSPTLIYQASYDLGTSYMTFGHYLEPIKQESDLSEGNLIYSGKLMGLCGYGNINHDWVPAFEDFYKTKVFTGSIQDKLDILSQKTNLIFDANNRFKDQIAYDIAATSQYVFEKVFFELVDGIVNRYDNSYTICMAGGCALNVLLNTSIRKKYNKNVFVTPNSSDCGIALGGLFYVTKPVKPINIVYAGVPILDINSIGSYTYERSYNHDLVYDPQSDLLAKLLHSGKILGIMRGNSEHGPRALGNRSILCDPTYPQMKDVLNSKVKHREWYRPFAPVVQADKAAEYFDILESSPYMSFAFNVKNKHREKLSSITHIDGTARVQTLEEKINPWLYNLLSEIEKINGYPILLNTSFNINGKPIASTIKEAFYLLDNTELDGLLVEKTLFLKK
jgi:carbamoyltransferase